MRDESSGMSKETQVSTWLSSVIEVAKYELRISYKRKKLIVAVILVLFFSTGTFTLNQSAGVSFGLGPNPDAAVGPHYDLALGGEFGFVALSLAIAMDSLTGDFERGTLGVLLTKPVTRGAVFTGKVVGSALILLFALVIIGVSDVVLATAWWGPQNNLPVMAVYVAGWFFSGLVFLSMIFAIASITKSTVYTVLISLTYAALVYSISYFFAYGSLLFLDYIPGFGVGLDHPAIGSGISGLGPLLAYYVLHPGASVVYRGTANLYPITLVIAKATVIGFAYLAVFLSAGYLSLKRAQIT